MAEPFAILVLNQISQNGLKRLPGDRYRVGKEIAAPRLEAMPSTRFCIDHA